MKSEETTPNPSKEGNIKGVIINEPDPYQELIKTFDPEAEPNLQKLVEHMKVYITNPEDIELVKKAFALTINMHGTQKRASGEPYYLHPVEVAEILPPVNTAVPTSVEPSKM